MMLTLLIAGFCADARAQDDAASTDADASADAADATSAEDALRRYLALQKGMYALLVPLESKAAEYQKHLGDVERWVLDERMASKTRIEPEPAPEPDPAPKKGSKNREKSSKPKAPSLADRLLKDNARLHAIYVREPTLCAEMDAILTQYVDAHSAELQSLVSVLLAQYKTMDDAQKEKMAATIGTSMAATPKLKSVHNMMALCVYKQKNELGRPTKYSPEKTWRRWYRIQTPLLSAWLRTDED